jgi:hypothetical protein
MMVEEGEAVYFGVLELEMNKGRDSFGFDLESSNVFLNL